jgi:hypothetical protein
VQRLLNRYKSAKARQLKTIDLWSLCFEEQQNCSLILTGFSANASTMSCGSISQLHESPCFGRGSLNEKV